MVALDPYRVDDRPGGMTVGQDTVRCPRLTRLTRAVENFLCGFKAAPKGPLAPPTRTAQRRSCFAPTQLASDAGRLARRPKTKGR
jgi:hypothetical protein